jgi:hypothetical protein
MRRIGRGLVLLAIFVMGALAIRAYDMQRGPPLDRWHTYVPHDLRAEQIDALTRFARFAGLAALPSILPAFAKSAWLAILPEFNPFKYNSFPVNVARQSSG